jgi:hypothetical protein
MDSVRQGVQNMWDWIVWLDSVERRACSWIERQAFRLSVKLAASILDAPDAVRASWANARDYAQAWSTCVSCRRARRSQGRTP